MDPGPGYVGTLVVVSSWTSLDVLMDLLKIFSDSGNIYLSFTDKFKGLHSFSVLMVRVRVRDFER